jgi:hypothetical protein
MGALPEPVMIISPLTTSFKKQGLFEKTCLKLTLQKFKANPFGVLFREAFEFDVDRALGHF